MRQDVSNKKLGINHGSDFPGMLCKIQMQSHVGNIIHIINDIG